MLLGYGVYYVLSGAPAPQIDDALAASLSRRRHQCYIRRLRITDRGLEGLGCRILQVCRLCGDRVGGLVFGQRARRLFVII